MKNYDDYNISLQIYMVQSSLFLSHILVLTGYRIVIRYALVIFNFRLAISNRIFEEIF